MKRTFLTIFFAAYYIFMPFVMVNCSVADQPYALDDEALVSSESVDEDALEECMNMEFLVEECIAILQSESDRIAEEEALVTAATLALDQFEECQLEEEIVMAVAANVLLQTADGTTDTTTPETVTEDVVDCAATIESTISAYQICDELTTSEKYTDCKTLENAVDDAVEACEIDAETVTEDFCSSLTA